MFRLNGPLGRFAVSAIWAVGTNAWVFFAGVISGVGGNVFATRALAEHPGPLWRISVEFGFFIASSALGLGAGEYRRRAEEAWKQGGARPAHKAGFLIAQLPGLLVCTVGALAMFAGGITFIFFGGR